MEKNFDNRNILRQKNWKVESEKFLSWKDFFEDNKVLKVKKNFEGEQM